MGRVVADAEQAQRRARPERVLERDRRAVQPDHDQQGRAGLGQPGGRGEVERAAFGGAERRPVAAALPPARVHRERLGQVARHGGAVARHDHLERARLLQPAAALAVRLAGLARDVCGVDRLPVGPRHHHRTGDALDHGQRSGARGQRRDAEAGQHGHVGCRLHGVAQRGGRPRRRAGGEQQVGRGRLDAAHPARDGDAAPPVDHQRQPADDAAVGLGCQQQRRSRPGEVLDPRRHVPGQQEGAGAPGTPHQHVPLVGARPQRIRRQRPNRDLAVIRTKVSRWTHPTDSSTPSTSTCSPSTGSTTSAAPRRRESSRSSSATRHANGRPAPGRRTPSSGPRWPTISWRGASTCTCTTWPSGHPRRTARRRPDPRRARQQPGRPARRHRAAAGVLAQRTMALCRRRDRDRCGVGGATYGASAMTCCPRSSTRGSTAAGSSCAGASLGTVSARPG